MTELRPYEENSNLGTERGVGFLANSVAEFGGGRPGLADRNGLMVAGNHSLQAIKDAGIPIRTIEADGNEWIVVVRKDWDLLDPGDPKARDYNYVDNLATTFGFQLDYRQYLKDTTENGVDLSGFVTEEEHSRWISLAKQAIAKEQAERKKHESSKDEIEVTCELGQIWEIGNHRIAVGDFRDRRLMERLLDGVPRMVFADPPFNTHEQQGRSSKKWGKIANDDKSPESFGRFTQEMFEACETYAAPDAPMYICCDWKSYPVFLGYSRQPAKALIVWDKGSPGPGAGYRSQHELIMFFGEPKKGDTNLWKFPRVDNYQHPNQKPVELVARAIANSSTEGDMVFDPFAGSGTVALAADSLSRQCRMVEVDPAWASVAIQRLAALGYEPTLLP